MDVLAWAHKAEEGAVLTYAQTDSGGFLSGAKASLESAWRAHEQGLVFLAQKRRHRGLLYQATRISPRAAKMLGLLPNGRGGAGG